MTIFRILLCIGSFLAWQVLGALPLQEKFQSTGYIEISNAHSKATFHSLYAHFDEFIDFLQKNPVWAQKIYAAKERFIRTKERKFYSTDFFGLYDESEREGRRQIAFYYSTHFHEFIYSHEKELRQIAEISRFLEACREVQKPYGTLFQDVATELGLETIFVSEYGQVPLLFKVIKYLPSYTATRPHYDGTAFSFFLDSTDNQSLLLSPYQDSFTVDDFSPASRESSENSILAIPGTLLGEFLIFPTPHIVVQSGITRYSTIAFAMRPHYSPPKKELSPLPIFKY